MTQHQKKNNAKNCHKMKIHLKNYYQSDPLANTTFNTKTKTKTKTINNIISLDQINK